MPRRLATLAALMLSVVSTGTVALVAAMSPAGAESEGKPYPSGNAPAAIDITKLVVNNGERRFTMRVAVRDLGQRGSFHFHYWGGRRGTPPANSVLIVGRRVDGDTRARFFACGREHCVRDSCGSLRSEWHPRTDLVEVSARQRCYPGADVPDRGRFFAWSRTGTAGDAGSSPFLLERG